MPRLYVSDLDGTLLGSAGVLSEYTQSVLRRLLGQGLAFTAASARSASSIRAVLAGLPLTLPVIEMDGAQITDLRTGEHLAVTALPPPLAAVITGESRHESVTPMLVCTTGTRDRLLVERATNDGAAWYIERLREGGDRRLEVGCPLEDGLRHQVTSLVHIGRLDAVLAVRERIERSCGAAVTFYLDENPYTPGWWWLRAQDARVSKGNALRQLAEIAGVSLADTVVFGDGSNDLPMFKVAGHAIAVANAVAEVQAAASETIGANHEDAVAQRLLADEHHEAAPH